MASKFGLAGGIPERRVRPIWDAVDSRQYKAALKLSTALLQKYPKSPYALALKAVVLERMGKGDDALSMCLEAKELLHSDTGPFLDDLTLSTLQIVLQRLDRLDLATSCYEHACNKYINNLEIMMGLFNCYVREYSYVKQQQTAIKMYKAVGEERFLMWAVCSIQLQVNYSSGGEKLLPLAEALIKKHINKSSLHEPEALTMYISILEQQKKFDAAFEVISGDLGSLILREEDKLRLKGRLLGQSCNYAAASEVLQKILAMRPDDYETFLQYLCYLLEEDIDWSKHTSGGFCIECISSSKSKLSEEEFDIRLSSALSFVEELQKDAVQNCTRGPYLAAIEIERRRSLNGNSNNSKVVEALVNYYERFGHYPCFATDVERYLNGLNEQEKAELLDKISNKFSVNSEVHTLGRAVTIYRMQEICSSLWKTSIQDLETTTLEKMKLFCKSLHLSKELDQQESMFGEELLFMATNTLVLLFWRTKKLGYLLEAILVVEFGLRIRRHANLLKVLLVHLYLFLGAFHSACDWYQTLDVKNILLETISHHILPQMLISPHFNKASDLMKEYLKFADDHSRDSGDLTCLAYRHRNYSRAIEFVAFHMKLRNSSQYLISKLDSFILDLKLSANNLDEVEKVLESANYGVKPLELAQSDKLEKLTCNIDSQTRPWWSPSTTVNYLSMPFDEETASVCFGPKPCIHKTNENGGPDKSEIERKSLVPRLVYLSMQAALSAPKENAETTNGGASSATIAVELGSLLERYARSIGFSFSDAIDAILSISTGEKSFKEFSDIVSCISFAIFVNAWNASLSRTENSGQKTISWESVDKLITSCVREIISSMGPALTSTGSEVLVLVQLVAEPLSWHIWIMQSFIKSLVPLGKRKKKSGQSDKQNINIPLMKAIHASVHCVSDAIGEVRKWVSDQLNRSEDLDLDFLMTHLTSADNSVGTGKILNVIKESLGVVEKSEVGDRIYDSVKSWDPTSVLRNLIGSQRKLLADFSQITDSKLRVLDSMKQSI
ncbi:hypothetical protein LUZ62_063466 [Rhynchospora pubera]|uniref:Uncharacterized protein n=1 Tax=Rhynchospora pubera TaxID=906938 RepID=A0AAV8EFJ3_9POAL|nr:hypothetical protein LUZ62_063466 [Rhynchospora pubera]